MRLLLTGFLGLIACGDAQPEEIYLTKDFYEWYCDDSGAIVVTTETNECSETGLHFIIATAQMNDGEQFKINLKNDEPCISSHWEERIPVQVFGYHCEDPGTHSDVDGVALSAYVDSATWSGAIFGE